MFGLTRSILRRTATVMYRRSIMTTASLRDSRSLIKLKQLQSDYQVEDGRPIFLKAGFRDRVLYTLTLVLCVVGVLGVLETLYQHIKPVSWRSPSC